MTYRAAIVGGGVIGGGWAARFLLNGWDIAVFDPDPEAPRKIGEVLKNARRSLPALYDRSLPDPGTLTFHETLAGAVSGADWIQESLPERLEIKHRILAEIQAHATGNAIIGSSTSGFKPSDLQAGSANPGQILVAHPFNPVYLLPLVELVPSAATSPETIDRAATLLTGIGMKPLHIRHEVDAHVADRLLEAVWREALWLIKDGICTTEELDDAIRYGFGLRWAQMGLFETYRIAGGEAGMKHFMAQFGPALAWPWTKLTDVPDFTDELVDLIAGQSDAQSGHMSIRALERLRDQNLVGIIRALKHTATGAGGVLAAHERTLQLPPGDGFPVTVDRLVPPTTTDANSHRSRAALADAVVQANDRLLELIAGEDTDTRGGPSYVTTESHLCVLEGLSTGDRLTITTQILAVEGGWLHLLHRIQGPAGPVATAEILLRHVQAGTRQPSNPDRAVTKSLEQMFTAHRQISAKQPYSPRIRIG